MYKGVIAALFHAFGKWPELILKLIICRRGIHIEPPACFNSLEVNPSTPQEVLDFMSLKYLINSPNSRGFKVNSAWIYSVWGGTYAVSGILSAKVLPMVEKKVLSSFAFSIAPVCPCIDTI